MKTTWDDRLRILKHSKSPLKGQRVGRVLSVVGQVIETDLTKVPIGQKVTIRSQKKSLLKNQGEIVGFRRKKALVIPYESIEGIQENDWVWEEETDLLPYSLELKGRVLDAFGQPLDGHPLPLSDPFVLKPEVLLNRRLIQKPIFTGVRAIDSFLTLGEGQRIGIMAGSGVGKSTLLGMIARNIQSDLNVIALIGERRREVSHFIKKNLGSEGLKKSVLIVTTGDQSPLLRLRAAFTATKLAAYFRDKGKQVLLMMDSVTRVAMASREIGLSAGEPPTSKGYPPSTFSLLPRLLEQAGLTDSSGSITGIYTVLIEGDDFNEPICDAVRGTLDGHINLTRELASANQFPAIDILSSLSRLIDEVVDAEHLTLTKKLRDYLSLYQDYKDLIELGLYKKGANFKVDRAVLVQEKLQSFLKQDQFEQTPYQKTKEWLQNLLNECEHDSTEISENN
jgi:flagellum-specific ATP synthase